MLKYKLRLSNGVRYLPCQHTLSFHIKLFLVEHVIASHVNLCSSVLFKKIETIRTRNESQIETNLLTCPSK